jgi:hypothetical protein
MARIETYVRAASPISGADKLIGTDSANNNETKNFTIQEISDFVGLGPYKVYTALLTQNGGSSDQYTSNGDLILGVTYTITTNDDNLANWTNVGAPNNNIGTSFVATGTTPISWGSNSELNYNTGAPVVTVLQNTIGNVWWTYDSVGFYKCNADDSIFNYNKTVVFVTPTNINDINKIYPDVQGTYIYIEVANFSNTWTDGLLAGTPIEIRVYN